MAEAHRFVDERRRSSGGHLFAGHDHALAARGKDVLSGAYPREEPLMPDYTLKIRRFDPQSGEAAHWDEHTVDLKGTRSVLDAILQIKADQDGSIGIRCSCQQGICGSCGVRINGKPGLACNTHLE